MTGEITLRGKVLPIGGVKEKVLAAHRAGIKTIIMPKDNEKDLADIPKNVLDALNMYLVGHMDEVLKIAMAGPMPAAISPEVAVAGSRSRDGRHHHSLTQVGLGSKWARASRYCLAPVLLAQSAHSCPLYMQRAVRPLRSFSPRSFPATGMPEIAMVGRSNVGKSSLINALVKQKIARTSAAPGKTRLANYYLIESPTPQSSDPCIWSILPGYGYARGGHESVEAFEQLTQAYFDPSTREQRRIAGVLQLVDSRHPDLPQDAAGYAWLLAAQAPVAIVATKIDKLNRSEQATTLRDAEGDLRLPCPAGLGVRKATGSTRSGRLIRWWADRSSVSDLGCTHAISPIRPDGLAGLRNRLRHVGHGRVDRLGR